VSIIIDTKIDAAAGYGGLTDYRAGIANDARCLGIWTADDVVQDVGGVSRVANFKTGGIPLVQTDNTHRPSTVYDPDLRRQVLTFNPAGGQFLTATGLTWNSDFAWTIIAIVKTTVGTNSADFHMIAGEFLDPNFVGVCTVNDRISYQVRTGIQARGATADVKGRDGWNRVLGINFGLYQPVAQANDGPMTTNTPAGSGNQSTATTFRIGNQFIPFGGSIDLVALFNVSIIDTAQADLRALMSQYLDERNGLFV
jgi:hypothetical protein